MTRCLILAALCLLLAGCTGGSSTTSRPAVDRPAIGPDGVFWEAVEAARSGDVERIKRLLSTGFVHRAILPNAPRGEPSDEEEFAADNARMERELVPHEATRARLYPRYTEWLRNVTAACIIETSRPAYDIEFKDSYGSARGPNKAIIKVSLHSAAIKEPRVFTVRLVQSGDTWLIDGFSPDALFGEFIR